LEARKVLLLIFVMTLHSFTEGVRTTRRLTCKLALEATGTFYSGRVTD
jgi:hypothetical protein